MRSPFARWGWLFCFAVFGVWGCAEAPVGSAEAISNQLDGTYVVDSATGPAADLQLNTEFAFSTGKFSLTRGGLTREFTWKLRSDTLVALLNGHEALRYRVSSLPSNRLKLEALGTQRCLWLRARE